MAGLDISFVIDASDVLAEREAILARCEAPEPLLARAGDILIGALVGNIDRQSFEGEPWPELRPGYERWKSREFPGQQMGRLTDEMYGSISATPLTQELAVVAGPSSSLRYPIFFNRRRPFVYLDQEARDSLRLGARWFVTGVLP